MEIGRAQLLEDNCVEEETIIHLVKAEDEEKWIVFDECGEGLQTDGDGTLAIFSDFESALEFALNELEEYYNTYKNISDAKLILSQINDKK